MIRLCSLPDSSVVLQDTFTRFIFVRHPFERLASAYIDKVMSLNAPPLSLYDSIRRMICRKFASAYLNSSDKAYYDQKRNPAHMIDEPCANVVPSFEHFVQYTLMHSVSGDVHWKPYSSLCQVCELKYNFIAKYETIQDDLRMLMSRLNLTSSNWHFNRRFSTGRTKIQYQSMYRNLSDRLICSLKATYHNDFELFDYHLDEYLPENRTVSCPVYRHVRRFA